MPEFAYLNPIQVRYQTALRPEAKSHCWARWVLIISSSSVHCWSPRPQGPDGVHWTLDDEGDLVVGILPARGLVRV